MANDQPFVELPSPPRSPSQTPADADVRGNNFGPTENDDETVRAIAYREHLVAMTRNKTANLRALGGSKEAFRTLQHKTLPLTQAAPPYIEADA